MSNPPNPLNLWNPQNPPSPSNLPNPLNPPNPVNQSDPPNPQSLLKEVCLRSNLHHWHGSKCVCDLKNRKIRKCFRTFCSEIFPAIDLVQIFKSTRTWISGLSPFFQRLQTENLRQSDDFLFYDLFCEKRKSILLNNARTNH